MAEAEAPPTVLRGASIQRVSQLTADAAARGQPPPLLALSQGHSVS